METRRMTVILEHDQFVQFEGYCRDHGYKKSTLVARLIRDLLGADDHLLPAPVGLPPKCGVALNHIVLHLGGLNTGAGWWCIDCKAAPQPTPEEPCTE